MPSPARPVEGRTVLWLPAHPSVGSVSMDHCWRELERMNIRREAAGEGADGGPRIACPIGSAPRKSSTRPQIVRAWNKYFAYPRLAARASRARGVKAVHVLDHAFAHLLAGIPRHDVFKIITLHDLEPLRAPGNLTASQMERFRKTVDHLFLADLVLAVSRATADDAINLMHLDAARIVVLPNGVDVARYSLPTRDWAMPWIASLAHRSVFLSVGSCGERKNLKALAAIFIALLRNWPPLARPPMLLRAGAQLPPAILAGLHAVLGEENVVELGAVSDEELIAAYRHADALIVPSRIEGFGLPVIEAMAAGCPVVCTNVTSLPEVGGNAALYFSPEDVTTAAGHLHALTTDPTLREDRVAAGLRQAASLSWDRHFEQLLDIYRTRAV